MTFQLKISQWISVIKFNFIYSVECGSLSRNLERSAPLPTISLAYSFTKRAFPPLKRKTCLATCKWVILSSDCVNNLSQWVTSFWFQYFEKLHLRYRYFGHSSNTDLAQEPVCFIASVNIVPQIVPILRMFL